ncbi:MAG: hypothetical protein WAN86_16945 [Hyphomicrobiaceae bacterium]
MKTLLSICALAGALTLGDAATERWAQSNLALAQGSSSACYQNCTNVRNWPAAQCARYCRNKAKRR